MPQFRITAYAEWFFAETIEAADVDDAQLQMTEMLRGRSLNPVAGPGIQFTNHRRIGEDVTTEQDPR